MMSQDENSKGSTVSYTQTQNSQVSANLKVFNPDEWSLSQFEVGRPLGKGRFGRVYLVREKEHKFICVLKTISMNLVRNSKQVELLAREVEINSHLNHENILKMFGYFVDEQRFYFILEFASQGDLYGILQKQPQSRFTEAVASNYVRQMVKALIYLKSKNILHRDIKPENIMVQEGILKLSDFGWAVHNPEKKIRTTHCGTLDYTPPEMLLSKFTGMRNQYDEGVDVWSVGILAYELSCGTAPFQSRDAAVTEKQIFTLDYQFPKYFSNELKDFVSKILKKDKKQRLPLEQMLEHPWIKKHQSPQSSAQAN